MPDRSAPNAAAAALGSAHLPFSAPAAAAPVFLHRVAREFRAALGFVFGLVSGLTAFAHRDDWLWKIHDVGGDD